MDARVTCFEVNEGRLFQVCGVCQGWQWVLKGRGGCGYNFRPDSSKTSEAVEKVGFSEEGGNLGDGKYLGEPRKSSVELPGAIQFLQISSQ